MKYLFIKNVPIINIMDKKPQGGIDWIKYGLNPSDIRRMQTQGKNANGDYITILPIEDELTLDLYIQDFISYAENTVFDHDEVKKIEQAEYESIKAEIETLREM